MAKHTPFGKTVKKLLIDRERTAGWLVEQIRLQTGAYCDDAYLSKILTGKKHSQRVEEAIRKILDMA